MARATQLCVNLPNKPGQLAKLARVLARAKVNVEAISVADTADCCLVRLVTSATARAKAALKRANMCFCQQVVVTAKLKNAPGQLAAASAKLAKAKVNINYVYGSVGVGGKPSLLVFGVDNPQKAARALG